MSKEWEALGEELRLSKRALLWPLLVMWAIEVVNLFSGGRLSAFGVGPRTTFGLLGILFMPLLHGSIGHLLGNTLGWLIAGGLLALSDARRFLGIMAIAWLTSGVGVWLTGASGSHHVGASGVIFGFFGYVLARGWVKKSVLRILASLAFCASFGTGIFFGILPQDGPISWQGHLFGFAGGILAAFVLGRRGVTVAAARS